MKITGKRSISSVVKIFLIILFILCLIAIVSVPILINNIENDWSSDTSIEIIMEMIFMYIAAIPALLMIVEFEKIFSSFEKENIFNRKIEKRLNRSSIYCLLIGIIFSLNAITYNFWVSGEIINRIMYLVVIILMAMIFLILSIGLMILKNIYKVSVDNKEENDLTI